MPVKLRFEMVNVEKYVLCIENLIRPNVYQKLNISIRK